MGITGSVLDPTRQLGEYEQMAEKILGEPLIHQARYQGERIDRGNQMTTLYKAGWSLSDIGRAYGFSKEWVRRLIHEVGMPTEDEKVKVKTKRHPG
jgi:hypothetical protein